jgi:hypothetical protein
MKMMKTLTLGMLALAMWATAAAAQSSTFYDSRG